jgi:hypothetical protein
MADSILLVALAVFSLFGIGLGIAGFCRRSWGLLLLGAVLCSMPVGFATVVMAMP